MAVTLTAGDLADALRLSTDGMAGTPTQAILTRQLAVAGNLIDRYLGDASDVDQATVNMAAIQICGHLFDYPGAPDVFVNSGAQALLRPYHTLGSARV